MSSNANTPRPFRPPQQRFLVLRDRFITKAMRYHVSSSIIACAAAALRLFVNSAAVVLRARNREPECEDGIISCLTVTKFSARPPAFERPRQQAESIFSQRAAPSFLLLRLAKASVALCHSRTRRAETPLPPVSPHTHPRKNLSSTMLPFVRRIGSVHASSSSTRSASLLSEISAASSIATL